MTRATSSLEPTRWATRFLKAQTTATIHHTATWSENRETSRESTWRLRLTHFRTCEFCFLWVQLSGRCVPHSQIYRAPTTLDFFFEDLYWRKIHMHSIEDTLQITVDWRCTGPKHALLSASWQHTRSVSLTLSTLWPRRSFITFVVKINFCPSNSLSNWTVHSSTRSGTCGTSKPFSIKITKNGRKARHRCILQRC